MEKEIMLFLVLLKGLSQLNLIILSSDSSRISVLQHMWVIWQDRIPCCGKKNVFTQFQPVSAV